MRKSFVFRQVLAIALVISTTIPAWANSPSGISDSLALLPASDAVAVIDVSRVMNELLPQIRNISPDMAKSVEKGLNEMVGATGIDLTKVRSAVIGMSLAGQNASGAAIIEGVAFDAGKIQAALKDKKQETKVVEYKGKQLYVVPSKDAAKAGEKVGLGIDGDFAFTQIGSDRIAVGTLSGVKGVVDGGSGNANSAIGAVLEQTKAGLIRFAANIPDSAKDGLAAQGDLFKQIATIKLMFGTFDMSSDFSVSLDTKMRTGNTDDASKLQTSLAGLVGIGKMFLGGNNDPTMTAINSVLDMIRIGAEGNDVSMGLTIPRSVFDKIAEASKKKPAK